MIIQKHLGRIISVMVGLSIISTVLAAAAFFNRQGFWFPGVGTEGLKEIRLEHGFAYIAPTHHLELSGQAHASFGMVLENGTPLPGPAGALHADIRAIGRGRFSFWGDSVYFSSSDNSAPADNRRSYQIRYPIVASHTLAVAVYLSALVLGVITGIVATCGSKMRERSKGVLSGYAGPLFMFIASIAGIFCIFLGGAYLSRNGVLWFGWMGEVVKGIQPEVLYGKSYLERGMQVVGCLLCLGAIVLGLLRILRIEVPKHISDMATFSAELLRNNIPLMFSCIVALAGGVYWVHAHPFVQPVQDLETIIVQEQIERAKTVNEADMIVIGDSSALMGVDATRLGILLGGKKVENFSTLAWVGAKGYAHILEMYFRRGLKAEDVLLLMHGVALDRPEDAGWDSWEQMVTKERVYGEPMNNPLIGFRSELNTVLFGRLFALPMPEAWGRYYGTQFEIGDAIRENNGSIYQPLLASPIEAGAWDSAVEAVTVGPRAHPTGIGLTYRLSPSAALGLREFAEEAAKFPIKHIFFGITPTLLSSKTEQSVVGNRRVEEEVGVIMRRSLDGRFELLNIEPFRADEYFASSTHLNQMGREHFTHTLAGLLARKIR